MASPECHGCKGKGWVDSEYKGAVICPVCKGSGKYDGSSIEVATINKNPLLSQLEDWLRQQSGIKLGNRGKTMQTYMFASKLKHRMIALVFVSTYGAGRVYLCVGDYKPADGQSRVKYAKVWGRYPQFEVQTPEDIEYAKKLVLFALNSF